MLLFFFNDFETEGFFFVYFLFCFVLFKNLDFRPGLVQVCVSLSELLNLSVTQSSLLK